MTQQVTACTVVRVMWEALYGSDRPVELVCFDQVVSALRDRFPAMAIRLHPSIARAIIPEQPGLDFDIHIALTNRDELHLRAAGLKCRWVACGGPGVTDEFIDGVTGLINGRNRIMLTSLFGKVVACRLQKPVGNRWRTIARHDAQRPGLLWLCRRRRILNRSARPGAFAEPKPRVRPAVTVHTRSRTGRPIENPPAGSTN